MIYSLIYPAGLSLFLIALISPLSHPAFLSLSDDASKCINLLREVPITVYLHVLSGLMGVKQVLIAGRET